MQTGTRMLHKQFKHGYISAESEIGGQMELNEKGSASFSSGGCAFTFIFMKSQKAYMVLSTRTGTIVLFWCLLSCL